MLKRSDKMSVSFYISSFESNGSRLRIFLEKSAFGIAEIRFETVQAMAFAHEFDIRGLICDIELQEYRYCVHETGIFRLNSLIIQNQKQEQFAEIDEKPDIYWIATPDEILEVISYDEPIIILGDEITVELQ